MGFIKAGLALGTVAFAGMAFMLSNGASVAEQSPTAYELPARGVAERYRLVLSGSDTGCDVIKGDSAAAQNARLILGTDCTDELPDLAEVHFWAEQEDGSVAFTAEDGRIAIRFAAGDGHAFETYELGAPLISLVAKEN